MDTAQLQLTPEQEAEAQRIEDVLVATARAEARHMSRLLASKQTRELLGKTEFEVRNSAHRIGAAGIDAALEQRKKRGTTDPS